LSEGQRQKVAINIVLIKNPTILIEDESTCAFDTGSENKVQQTLDIIMKVLTVKE
jgi:ABC-type multidrug transport system fused ATPase/permease subunit